MNTINNITDKIILMAKKYEDALNEETQRQLSEIREEYQSKAEYITRKIRSDTQKECDEILARAKSEAEFRKRNIILSAKVELIDSTIESAKEKIKNLPENEYLEFNSKMLIKTIRDYEKWESDSAKVYDEDFRQGRYVLRLCAADKKRIGEKLLQVAKDSTTKEVVLCERDYDIDGGFIFVAGNIEINCTIKSLIDNKRASLVGKLNQVLFG